MFAALGWAGIALLVIGGIYSVADHPPVARESPYMGLAWATRATRVVARSAPWLLRAGGVLMVVAAVGSVVT